ncbi:hypothetical protein CHI04_04670 [Bacillus safensis]|nr:hypothetical protein [Bacillus sp. F2HM]PAK36681.1 hypothetical protein CHI04_04670 [Bacillus safensis]
MLKALSVNQLLEKTKNKKLSFSKQPSYSKPKPHKKAAEFIDSFTLMAPFLFLLIISIMKRMILKMNDS